MICMSWATFLQARPSGERLVGFQAVGAVLRKGGEGRQERPCGGLFGTSLGSFWVSFFDVFLKCLFQGFGLHFGSQNTSKMRPKRGSKSKHENHRFCHCLLHFGHIQGC